MDERTKAYLAGIIDGEGTITLTRLHKNQTPSPVVSVSNTHLPLLQWIRERAGGAISSKNRSKPHHTISYVWSIRHDKAIHLLKEIKKYLLIKKKHADLVVLEYKKVTHRAGKYTPEMLRKKNALVQKIRKLNQR